MKPLALALPLLAAACGGDDSPGADAGPPACDPDVAATICTIAGRVDVSGYDGDQDQPALEARMSLPTEILAGADGELFILDWNNHRVRALKDGVVRHVAGRGELGGTLDDPANSDFNHPTGLLLSDDGRQLTVAAWHNSKIRTIDLPSGDIVDTCGDGRRAYFGDGDADGPIALDLPSSIARDPDGALVILDQANQVIRRLGADGVIERIVGQCVVGPETDLPDGAVLSQCPNGSGKTTYGVPADECGKPCNPTYAVGDALTMRMAQPFGQSADPGGRLVYDASGALLFADTSNHLIRRVTAGGAVEVVVGVEPQDGLPQSGVAPDGTPALEARLDRPTDLALGADGTLYFSDVYNHCVRKLAADGKVYTVAGTCGVKGFAGDGGAPTAAELSFPYGIDLAGDRLYIADAGNQVIRVVNL